MKNMVLRMIRILVISVSFIFLFNSIFVPKRYVLASDNINNDTVNKVLTINCSNISLQLDYDKKCKITSLKVNNVETIDSEGIISAVEVTRGTEEIATSSLKTSPSVNINGNVATISEISYSNAYITINETWTLTANDENITLNVDKAYHWLNNTYDSIDMKALGLTFKRDVFDTCFREDGGVNALLSPTDRTKIQDMDDDGTGPIGYNNMTGIGFYGGNVDLLSNPNSFVLSVNITSDRKIASEYLLADSTNHAMRLEHKLSIDDFSHTLHNPDKSLCFHVFNINAENEDDKHAYDPVFISDSQIDSCTYTFSASNNLEKYYDVGYFPSSSGIDEEKLARFMIELGRTSIVDLKGPAGSWNTLLPEFAGLMESQLAPDPLLAMQYTKENEIVLEALKALVEVGLSVQETNGHIRGCAGGQAYEYPDVSEPCAGIPMSAAAYINAKNDRTWANSPAIKNGIRKSLDYLLLTDSDGNGLVENTYKINNGVPQQAWLDSLFQGGEDAYINALTYEALIQWADIEANIINDTDKANYYLEKAALLKETYNKDLINGGLWSNRYKSFIGWRNMDGSVKCDTKYLWVDAAAIKYGVATKDRANEILFGSFDGYRDLDDWMIKNGAKAYPLNLYPNDSTEELSQFVDEFPDWENGDVFPHLTGEMMGAYARMGSTLANKYMRNLLELFFTQGDPLWVKDVYTWSLETNTHGCDYRMGVNMHSAATLITDIFGIKPRYDCLEVNPCIDNSLYGTEINYYMRGHQFRIKYDSNMIRTVKVNDGVEIVRFKWNNLLPGNTYTVKDEDISDNTSMTTTVVADADGMISFDIIDGGEHKITVQDTMTAFTEANRSNVEASSINGNDTEDKAIDNNNNTYWSSALRNEEESNEWIIVDMGQLHTVKKIIVTPRSTGIGFPVDFRFKASMNKIDWVDIPGMIFNNYPNPGSSEQVFVFQLPITARYICMEATKLGVDGANYTMQISEIKPYYIEDAVTPEPWNNDAVLQFSSTQGENNWYYMENANGQTNMMIWNSGYGAWQGSAPYALQWADRWHPDIDHQTVRMFKVPRSGLISITGNVKKESETGDGVRVKILKNNSVIWPELDEWQHIMDTTGLNFDYQVVVEKGDEISFVLDCNQNSSYDTTFWNPVISYLQMYDYVYDSKTGFSNVQGEGNWYYKEYTDVETKLMTWNSGYGAWVGSAMYALIFADKMHPDVDHMVARIFKAPQNGTIIITGNVRKEFEGGDGVRVKIKRNNNSVWPESGDWQTVIDTEGYDISTQIDVIEGDEIAFVLDTNGTSTADGTYWTPVISYIIEP